MRGGCCVFLLVAASHLPLLFADPVFAQLKPTSQPAITLEEIRRLVVELDSPHYAIRETAQKRLLEIGEPAAPVLRAALKSGTLSEETERRVALLYDKVCLPPCGIIWRSKPGSPYHPKGIADGDIVLACDGRPIRTLGNFKRTIKEESGFHTLRVWRKKRGTVTIETNIPSEKLSGFFQWPDILAGYERYDPRGPWDTTVKTAFILRNEGNPRAAEAFEKAWNAGCRSAIVATFWITSLCEADHPQQAVRQADQLIASHEVQNSTKDGIWHYGMLPYQKAFALTKMGKYDQLMKWLDQSEAAAVKAKSTGGASLLRYVRMKYLILGPADQAQTYWRKHAKDIRRSARFMQRSLAPAMAVRLAAERGPAAALEFLQNEPKDPTLDSFITFYKQQVKAQKIWRATQRTAPHMVLVAVRDHLGPFGPVPQGSYVQLLLPELTPAARIEYEVKIAYSSATGSPVSKSAEMGLIGDQGGILRLRSDDVFHLYVPHLASTLVNYDISYFKATDWHRATIEVAPYKLSTTIDGRPFQTLYFATPNTKNLQPYLLCVGLYGEFRNIRFYIASDTPRNNAALEKAFLEFSAARTMGNLATAQKAYATVRKMLQKIPAARPYLAHLQKELFFLKRIVSAEGLRPADKDVFALHETYWGQWDVQDDCLIGRFDEEGHPPLFSLPLRVDNVEIRGVAYYSPPDSPAFAVLPNALGVNAGYTNFGVYPPTSRGPRAAIAYAPPDGTWLGKSRQLHFKPGRPMPFCIRVRGSEGSLFLEQGNKPFIRYSRVVQSGDSFCFGAIHGPNNRVVVFRDLAIRHLSDDETLDGPVILPKVQPLPPAVKAIMEGRTPTTTSQPAMNRPQG